MSGRHALIVATYDYRDPGLKKLVAPRHDAQALAEVLADRDIAGFEVTTLVNEPHYVVGEAIGDFFAARRRDELSLLYFTGHGLKDDESRLFLAMTDTRRERLLFTALSAQSINDAMNTCRSRETVLILDCCYSGAFPGGYTAKADTTVHTLERFAGGRGKVVLTASDATQYSFEGNQLSGDGSASVFTRHLVEGLRSGAADQDEDGDIALDELYTYVYERVVAEMPQQRPKKQDDVEGRIVIAHNIRWDLPDYVRNNLASPIPGDRLQALANLARLHANGNPAVRARVIARLTALLEDDSKQVSQAAAELLRRCAPVAADTGWARRQADEQQRRDAQQAQQRRLAEEQAREAERQHQAAEAAAKQRADAEQRKRPTVDNVADPSSDVAAQDRSSMAAVFFGTSAPGDDPRRDASLSPDGPGSVVPIVERQLPGHTATVAAVATAQLDGRLVVISGSRDKTMRVWDLATGRRIGTPSTTRKGAVWAVATAQLDGRPVIISGGWNRTVRVWDLATHTPIGTPFAGHTGPVAAVAAAQLNGRPVVISGSEDKTIRVWDMATGKPIGALFTRPTYLVFAVTTAQLDGHPVVISGGYDKTVRLWDLATGQPVGIPFTGHTASVLSVTTAQLNGHPVVISGSQDETVRVSDLATGQPVGTPFTGHTASVLSVTTAELNGRPVAISGSDDDTVRVWDLATGQPIGSPFTGHTGAVRAVATGQLNGQPLVVSGSDDTTVRVWDLTARARL